MDELDNRLLQELVTNARLPVATLARRLGVARTTVQARLEKLERDGTIVGYAVRLGGRAGGRPIRATALLQIEPRATPGVLARLKSNPAVEQAHTTSGRFDLVLRLAVRSTEELDSVLDAIGGMPGVKSSESLIHLSTRIDRAL